MKKFVNVTVAFCLFFCLVFAAGCYVTQSQEMENVTGTYKLTRYDVTEKHYDENDQIVTTVTDEIEEQGLEIYLVVTGESNGYYAYKSNAEGAYVKEIALTYEEDSEEKGKYNYVAYKDIVEKEFVRLGVTKSGLNQARPAICSKLFGKEVSQTGFDRDWSRVSKDVDLSYVQSQWGEVPRYSYEGWGKQGGYRVYTQYAASDLPEGATFTEPYVYYFIVLDAWKMQATTYYAERSDGAHTPQKKTEDVVLLDDWNKLQIGDAVWTVGELGIGYVRKVEVGNGVEIAYQLSATQIARQNAVEEVERQVALYAQTPAA